MRSKAFSLRHSAPIRSARASLASQAAIGELLQAAPADRDQRSPLRQPAPHDPAAALDLPRDQRIGHLGEAGRSG